MLKRLAKILLSLIAILIIGAIIVVVGGYLLITHVTTVNASSTLTDLPLNTWTRIDLSAKTMCSDGSDYRIYARRAKSDNLLIHFAGGGMAWDAKSASQPITFGGSGGFYFPNIWEIIRATLGGIFAQDKPKNPFADWNEVYIPYCTADFHIGNTSINYTLDNGTKITIHHNGRQNVTEALDWIYTTFKQPPKLVVSGESAGAFGSTFWVPDIASHYPQTATYNLSDGAYLNTPLWANIVNNVWQADTENTLGFTPADNLINSAYLRPTQPHVTYLQINTLYDGTLTYFASVLNDKPYDAAFAEAWSQGMRASVKQVSQSNLDYNYYLTDYGFDKQANSTPHTSVSGDLFYAIQQDNIALVDWVQRVVINDEHLSVGSEFLP
ncbi:MAG: hypothetical protein H0X30_31870 [Anaerolineae bacterium]|nr:hypothetical protein [Anaerolineae bacterium]